MKDLKENYDFEMFCEHSINPIFIQKQKPGFSWRFENRNGNQTKYRILVAGDPELIKNRTGDCWDSGVVCGNDSLNVRYAGAALGSKKRYYWKVEVWTDDSDEPFISDTAYFETAIFDSGEWSAQWIEAPDIDYGVEPLIRKEFTVHKKTEKAKIYISGIGYYYLYINGRKVGDRYLEPGWTDYRKRVLYSVFDVTDYITEGDNIIGVELGNGWLNHRHESFIKYTGSYPDWSSNPKLLLEMNISFDDGTSMQVTSGENSGFIYAPGPVIQNGVYNGEVYDATKEIEGWNDVGTVNGIWKEVKAAVAPGGKPVAQAMPPIRITGELKPKEVKLLPDGAAVYDFGQNFAGWAEVECKGPEGSSVTMKYAETVNDDGSVNQKNLRAAKACDKYFLNGKENNEKYQPRFTYHGFRYVAILPQGGAEIISATGKEVHTDVQRTSSFKSSNEILNKIYDAVIWTEKSNMHGIPTDCPQRDERMAWLNDMAVRCEEAVLNFDLYLFYEKWLADIADAQAESGSIPDTAPFIYGGNPSYHISSSFILVPWFVYVYYGEKSLMSEFYNNMKRYVEFLNSQTGEDGIIGEPYYGEWAPPAAECYNSEAWGAIPKNIPHGIITTCYLFYDSVIMSEISEILEKDEDRAFFNTIAAKTGEAVNRKYFNTDGFYATNSQGSNIFPLFLGLAEKGRQADILGNILKDLKENDFHITTGNQMTKYLFEVLDSAGENKTALKIAESKTYPSLGYMIENGATTIWERWEILNDDGMNSHNHPMHAAYTVWLFKALGGFRFDKNPGDLNEILIEPATETGLKSVETEFNSVKGRICSSWFINEDSMCVKVKIPWNTKAKLKFNSINGYNRIFCGNELLSDGKNSYPAEGFIKAEHKNGVISISLQSGEYVFVIKA